MSVHALSDQSCALQRFSPAGPRPFVSRVSLAQFRTFSGDSGLVFGVSADCFQAGGDPVALTVAGLDGLYVEPYEGSSVTFIPPRAARRREPMHCR